MLDVRDLTVRYGARTVVDRASFSVAGGQWLMLLGPNGAGKSTILSAISQGAPYSGSVSVCGLDARIVRPAALARRLGVLMQSHAVGYAFTVEEVVRLGRYAYAKGALSGRSAEDDAAVERALAETGLTALSGRSVLQLSGGELQRTFLAQLFAQNPSVLLLDEPTNNLDLVYQKQVFSQLSAWLQTPGRAIVSVVHDLSLALAYGTHALLLKGGVTVAYGAIGDVLTEENLARAYDMDVYAWMRMQLSQWETKREEPNHGLWPMEQRDSAD